MSVFHVPDEKPPKRDKQLLIRLSAEEKDGLETQAKRLGVTSSELVRRAVNNYLSALPKSKKKT